MGTELGPASDDPKANLDALSIFYMTFAVVWTGLLVLGMVFLYRNRRVPLLRIRGLGLSLASISLLHLYWLAVVLAYTYGAFMPEVCQYWIMGVYFPFGIALFQASNSQFLHVAKAQRKFASPNGLHSVPPRREKPVRGKGIFARIRSMDYSNRMLTYIGMGMVVQLFLTVFCYLISRKFHPGWGIPGTGVHGATAAIRKDERGQGWEWWPTLAWQFIWAWIVAPIILWRSRDINDTLGWRFQTIGCCLAGLPATPMWLAGIYAPGLTTLSTYWVPPMWYGFSITFMEIFTIFLPAWQVLRHRTLRQETLECIAAWESKKRTGGSHAESVFSGSTKVSKSKSDTWKSMSNMERGASMDNGSIYTMEALEAVLEQNPEPLREFSAFRDFSGENIAFLTAVSEWKSSGRRPSSAGDAEDVDAVRERFNQALRIYVDYIGPRDAEFCINIASTDLKRLEAVFEKAARILYGDRDDVNAATPFDDFDRASGNGSEVPSSPTASEKPINVQFWGEIPEGFSEDIFDDAERSIKYLVLTNTWPKYVRERRSSIDSNDSGYTFESHKSESSIKKAVKYVKSTFSKE